MTTITIELLPADAPDTELHRSSGERLAMQTEPDVLAELNVDAAAMRGRGAAGVLKPRGERELSAWLRAHPTAWVLAQGARTSLTGGATPDHDVVISLERMTGIRIDAHRERVVCGAGLPLAGLHEALAARGLYYPPAPTHDGATVGGNVSTNAAGAATFKYGTTRDWVEQARLVLRHGERLVLRRGQHVVRSGDVVRLAGERTLLLQVPGYSSPELKKTSAGYFVRSPMDLIDLFIGSEGTLGILTEVELRVVPRPHVLTGLVFVPNVNVAVDVAWELRERSMRTRSCGGGGLDVRSIELFDGGCLELLRAEGKLGVHQVQVPAGAGACLLLEQEVDAGLGYEGIVEQLEEGVSAQGPGRGAVGQLMQVLDRFGLVEHAELAMPQDTRRQRQLAGVREAIPLCISEWLRKQQRQDPSVHKVGGDMIVPFDRFPEMLAAYYDAFARRGLQVAVFGHISDGNVHPNVLPRDAGEMQRAKDALLELADTAKRMGGCPLSEHGVGKHPLKKQMLARYWGRGAIAAMQALKGALDPRWTLARGVFFDAPEALGTARGGES